MQNEVHEYEDARDPSRVGTLTLEENPPGGHYSPQETLEYRVYRKVGDDWSYECFARYADALDYSLEMDDTDPPRDVQLCIHTPFGGGEPREIVMLGPWFLYKNGPYQRALWGPSYEELPEGWQRFGCHDIGMMPAAQ